MLLSEQVVQCALYFERGDVPHSKRRRTNGGAGQNFAEIEYDDLQDHESSPRILLEMQDRQRYFEGQLGGAGDIGGGTEDSREVIDAPSAFKEFLQGIDGKANSVRMKILRCRIVVYDANHLCTFRDQDKEIRQDGRVPRREDTKRWTCS
ncbi:hypothetical protein JVU11DRAFT_9091 [Chiua virens]|nr:hypothetical protein JVU11DRAFT_9091 [Chiua virens]